MRTLEAHFLLVDAVRRALYPIVASLKKVIFLSGGACEDPCCDLRGVGVSGESRRRKPRLILRAIPK